MFRPAPPGTLLANDCYRVIALLGKGGMGAVYEAENTRTHKRVAIKCLRPTHDAADVDSARLVREAKASARIRHPNVVDVYDVVSSGELVCLVMEYLEGQTLEALLKAGPLPYSQALALLMPVMRGVAAAHRQGVVHRDLKPANIFLAKEEDAPAPVPKLLDFGVSKLGGLDTESLTLTVSGQIVGTPLYMPLEQFSGGAHIDARVDVYGLGVVLYEALTGQMPFQADTLPSLIVRLTTSTPTPPHALRADIPPALGEIVLRALARERDQRTESVERLLRELEAFANGTSEAAAVATARPRRSRARLVVGIVLASCLLAGAALAALRSPAPHPAPVDLAPPPSVVVDAGSHAEDRVEDAATALPEPEVAPTVPAKDKSRARPTPKKKEPREESVPPVEQPVRDKQSPGRIRIPDVNEF